MMLLLHLISESVMALLTQIRDARGTCAYLDVIQCVIDSFLNKNLNAVIRLQKAWYAVFFSCITLKNNFITLKLGKKIE